jgi:uncharacterized protein YegP (UPF0339 family)
MKHEDFELEGMKPVELRQVAREMGIEQWSRLTGPRAIEAILQSGGLMAEEKQEGQAVQSRYEVYKDRAGQWRWQHIADNGRIIADSAEGYDSKANAERAKDREIELAAEEWTREPPQL